MTQTVKFSDLEQLLVKTLAFQQTSTAESQIFEHTPTGTLILLPPLKADEGVPLYHLIGMRRLLDERGIIEANAFDKLLENASSSLATK